jgi:hypothetical protein
VIFKATKYSQEGWFESLPCDWKINISNNGWTTDKIGMDWLINHFIPYTNGRTMGRYRMLILDGHGSHLVEQRMRLRFNHIDKINFLLKFLLHFWRPIRWHIKLK